MQVSERSAPRGLDSMPPQTVPVRVFAFLMLALVAGFGVWYFESQVDPAITDARADWIVVSAAVEGLDPWSDLPTLASALGTEYIALSVAELGQFERVHPRTPAALLLLTPILLVASTAAYSAMLIAGMTAFLMTALILGPRFNWFSPTQVIPYAIVSMTTAAFLQNFQYGAQSTLILLLVGVALQSNRRVDSIGGGLALGAAICLKMFPALLLIPLLWYRKYRAAMTAVVVFVVLNAVALWLFELDLREASIALGSSSAPWVGFSGNGSLAVPLVSLGVDVSLAGYLAVAVAFVASAVVVVASRSWEVAFSTVLVIALLGSPLAWAHYGVVGLLVAGYLLSSVSGPGGSGRRIQYLVGLWFALQLFMFPTESIVGTPTWTSLGSQSLAANLVLLAACLLHLRHDRSIQETDDDKFLWRRFRIRNGRTTSWSKLSTVGANSSKCVRRGPFRKLFWRWSIRLHELGDDG
jgi:hypothetical protein